MMNKFTWVLIILLLISCLSAEDRLGRWFTVVRNDSPWIAAEGDMGIYLVHKGKKARLIKDDSVAETVVMAPVRVFLLMFRFKARGNWLMEDEKGNRGYMWDSDLELTK